MHRVNWLILIPLIFILSGCSIPKLSLFGGKPEPLKEYTLQGTGDEKILVLSIDGSISTSPSGNMLHKRPSMVQQIAAYLKRAEQDPQVKVLMLKVNSPGGTVTASDILYHELKSYKERTGVKMVVSMMNIAASGAYYLSLPADFIMAHPTTLTGSIGVIFSRPGVAGLMEKAGVSMQVNKSGAEKDMGSPYRPTTEVENAIFQKLTDDMAKRFHNLVLEHRKLTPDQYTQISSARIYLAEQAKSLGLIDGIGYLDDAIDQAKKIAGLDKEAKVVAYRRYKIEDDTIYNPAIQSQEGDLETLFPLLSPLSVSAEADFYYIWPAAMGH